MVPGVVFPVSEPCPTVRFLHAADLHLDTPFRGLSRQSPERAELLRDASLEAFDVLVDTALREQVAFCLFAGDIYDGPQRGVRAQLRFRDGLARLSRAGIASFVVHGNHDPADGWSAVDSWPDGVHLFDSERVRTWPVRVRGRTVATVSGISFASRHERRNLAAMFPPAEGPGLHVALLHTHLQGVAGGSGHESYAPSRLADLESSRYHYWALGHIHTPSTIPLGSGTVAVYPGNLQGRGFRPSERGPKGVVIVEFDPSDPDRGVHPDDISFRACDRVRFESVEIEWGNTEPLSLDTLADLFTDAVPSDAADRLTIIRGTVHGRGPVHDVVSTPGRLEELTESLRDRARRSVDNVEWDRVVDRTTPAFDIDSLREGDDLVSDLLSIVDELLEEPGSVAEVWSPEPPPSLRRTTLESSGRSLRAMLAAARDLALEVLLEGSR